MRTYCYGAKAPTVNAERVRQQIERAHRYYNDRIVFLREEAVAQARASTLPPDARKAANATAHEAMLACERDVRHHSGLYSGTYLQIEDATRKAQTMSRVVIADKEGRCPRCKQPFAAGSLITLHATKGLLLACEKCGNGPRFRRWDDSGMVAVQIQYGMTAAELVGGEDTRARLVGEGKHRDLWLRVGSEGRAPIWAIFPVVYHREIPASARIKWVRLCTWRVGTHAKWSAQFVLDAPEETWSLPSPTLGAVAVDVGWRDLGPAGLRVAVWTDDAGRHDELRLPRVMLDRDQKVSDLRSIRDKNFTLARDALVAERRANCAAWPEWLREQTHSLHQWKASAKLAGLTVRWRERRWDGDAALFDAAEAWRKQDKHLLNWECEQREAILRERLEVYRLFALQLAQYRRVTVERLDLDELADSAPDDLQPVSRAHRFDAGLSYLLNCAADAVHRAGGDWVEVDPAMTTQWCHEGDHEERFDAAPRIEHQCSCGRTWDQDWNAARNLLTPPAGLLAWQAVRAVMYPPKPARRSRAKKADATEETGSATWRRKGLEKRRAKRSKKDGDGGGNTGE